MSPSTYNYYERGRIPPMTTLVKISESAGVDLRWLLTGQAPSAGSGGSVSPEHARILSRLSAVLPQRLEAAVALNALLDLPHIEIGDDVRRGSPEDTGDVQPRPGAGNDLDA